MAETIRERIESLQSATQFAEMLQAGEEWQAGNLIPADEVQARIDSAVSEAVRAETDRCAQIAEDEGRRSISCSGAYIAQRIRKDKP